MGPHRLLATVLVLAAACQQGGKSEDQQKAAAPGAPGSVREKPALPEAPSEPLLDPGKVIWKAHELPGLGISMSTIDGVEVTEGTFNQGANYTRQDKRPLVIALWHGEGRNLENWRGGLLKAEMGEETSIQVCGRHARRQEARLPASRLRTTLPTAMSLDSATIAEVGGKPADPARPSPPVSAWRENPARTIVAVAFERNGTPVLATFAVETDQRDAFRVHEERFFANLKCN